MSTEQRSGRGLRVVLDTNVIMSGLNFSGNERRVLVLARGGNIQVYLSPFILDEAREVLQRKFRQSAGDAQENVDSLLRWVTIVDPTCTVDTIVSDEDDNRILECCLESNAHYLITGDRRDLLPLGRFHETVIVNAADFLKIFDEESVQP